MQLRLRSETSSFRVVLLKLPRFLFTIYSIKSVSEGISPTTLPNMVICALY